MQDFIERLRAKPEHVRKQIAIATSGVLTGLVAVGWLASLVAGGTLALKASDTVAEPAGNIAEQQNGFESLLGAAGSFAGVTTEDPELTVLESRTSSTLDRNQQEVDTRTVIPF
ncbi:hypothetical protein KKH15_00435 [Patescibacteria group bacterium]|nr:hypothetical protein [Patescibacteria group bacterium]MBU1754705.1 hypothetical protein [Patescibacteria group bacterium]